MTMLDFWTEVAIVWLVLVCSSSARALEYEFGLVPEGLDPAREKRDSPALLRRDVKINITAPISAAYV